MVPLLRAHTTGCPGTLGQGPDMPHPSTWVPVSKQFDQYPLLSKQWVVRAREESFLQPEAGQSLEGQTGGKDFLDRFLPCNAVLSQALETEGLPSSPEPSLRGQLWP